MRGFFDQISHEWLVKFVEHRIADRCVVRLIRKWLNAGGLEDGKRIRVEEGTPRDRLPGADPKLIQAAAVKSRAGERWRKSAGINPCRGASERRTQVNPSKTRR